MKLHMVMVLVMIPDQCLDAGMVPMFEKVDGSYGMGTPVDSMRSWDISGAEFYGLW